MNNQGQPLRSSASRRDFLKQSGGGLAGAAYSARHLGTKLRRREQHHQDRPGRLWRTRDGRRCASASTKGPTKLWAMADFFSGRLDSSLKNLSKKFAKQVDVPEERQFIGLEGYKNAIESLGPNDLVILATPPAFRPIHVEYAVEKGRNIFMEKSFAVDAPGIQRLLKAGRQAAKKNLKVAGGLMMRHDVPLAQAIEQIHGGAIGDLVTCWAYRMQGPRDFKPRLPGMSELAHQIRNYSNFTWLNGTFMLDWMIHQIDVCCWAKDAWPVSAQGQGGRQVRTEPDQLFDHEAVEFSFADGTRLMAQFRLIAGCWDYGGCVVHGAKGSARIGEGVAHPRLYKDYQQTRAALLWDYQGPHDNPYQYEHDLLFEAIRQDKPYNETERCAKAAMSGILGRMAAESGKMVTWEEAMASKLELAPGLDRYTMDSQPPVMPDAQDHYPIAMPGTTKAF